MIDAELVKEHYAQMPDEKLTAILKLDGVEITYEAFIILKREYYKRKLNPDLLTEIENKRLAQSKQKIHSNFKKEAITIENKLWNGVLKLKSENKSNKEIFDWLLTKDVQPEAAIEGIKHIELVAKALYKRAKKAMLLSFLLFFGGIILCIVHLQEPINITYAIYGIILALAPLRFFYTNHNAYKLFDKVIEILNQEKNEVQSADKDDLL